MHGLEERIQACGGGCRPPLGPPPEGSRSRRVIAPRRAPPARPHPSPGNRHRADPAGFSATWGRSPATPRGARANREERLGDRNGTRTRRPPVRADPGRVGAFSGPLGTLFGEGVAGLPEGVPRLLAGAEGLPEGVRDGPPPGPGWPGPPPCPPGTPPEGGRREVQVAGGSGGAGGGPQGLPEPRRTDARSRRIRRGSVRACYSIGPHSAAGVAREKAPEGPNAVRHGSGARLLESPRLHRRGHIEARLGCGDYPLRGPLGGGG